MDQIRVAVRATDPLSHAGLAGLLQPRPEFTVLGPADRDEAEVLVLSADRLSVGVVAMLRRSAAEIGPPVVLVTQETGRTELLAAIQCRVVAVLPRTAATADRVAHSVLVAAAGGGVLSPALIGELLRYLEARRRDVPAPDGPDGPGLTQREIDVLRLISEGFDTGEIAGKLRFSERTVKNVIYGVTRRLKLRNRSHAVAYALRTGLI